MSNDRLEKHTEELMHDIATGDLPACNTCGEIMALPTPKCKCACHTISYGLLMNETDERATRLLDEDKQNLAEFINQPLNNEYEPCRLHGYERRDSNRSSSSALA